MALTRIPLVVLAVVAAAWFALAASEAREVGHVTGVVTQSDRLSAPQARAALDQLNSAGRLNPDRHVDVLRATVLAQSGQTQPAVALLTRVVQAEPMNLEAWYALAKAGGANQALESFALHRILQLVPSLRPRK